MYSKIAISACRRVSQGRRQISSALMVFKNVSTIARQAHAKHAAERGRIVITTTLAAHGDFEANTVRMTIRKSCEQYWLPRSLWKMQPLGGVRKAMSIFRARIAKSRFMRLLTAQPITRRECRSRMIARYSQPSRVQS